MEIEKKYLVDSVPFALENFKKTEICQSYISTTPTIRIRKSGVTYFLCVKGKGHIAREEFELEINEEEYQNLSLKAENNSINKTRYFIPIEGGFTAELDIYHGFLQGLITVEVEFATIKECEGFVPPNWFAEDVSQDKRYKNSFLAIYGLQEKK